MRTELPAVSFVCVGLLVLLSPVFVHSRNVAVISLAVWLFCCNLIHGVDALVWDNNDAIHAPVWCDIVSRVLLASQLALPGCALTMARNLRRCAVGREVVQKAYTTMQDLTFCLIIPTLYIVLHVIVQSHRFDITTNFGCSASIYTSSVSVIIIWIPPLALCVTTFVYAFLAIRGRLDSGLVFFSHMQDSPRLNIFAFIRPLLTSSLIASVSFSTTIFSMYARIAAIGGLKTWSVDTWSSVHANMTQVYIVPQTARLNVVRTEVEWWVVPSCALVLVMMTLLGLVFRATDDSSRGYQVLSRWFRTTVLGQPLPEPTLAYSSRGFRPHMISSTPSSPTLVGDRKSVVSDDAWDSAASTKVKLATLTKLVIPDSPPSASSSSSMYTSPDMEDPFVKSTMTYIESPTGREVLGLPPFPPALYSPPRPTEPFPPPPTAPSRTPSPKDKSPSRKPSTKERSPPRKPRPNSILSAPWPRPPSVVPISPRTPSPKSSMAPITVQPPSPVPPTAPAPSYTPRPPSIMSITTSLASSTLSMSAYGVYDDTVIREPHGAGPFQEHLSETEGPDAGPGLGVPRHVRRKRSRDVLPRSLSAAARGRRQGSDGLAGGIYMTVVKEMV